MTIFKKIIGMIRIPKNTLYCYDYKNNKPCPYIEIKAGIEYCRFLKAELDIQDMVKDCGINRGKL